MYFMLGNHNNRLHFKKIIQETKQYFEHTHHYRIFSIHFYSFLFTFLFVFMKPDEPNSVGSAHTGGENPKSSFHSCFKRHLGRETSKAFCKC